MKKTQLYLFLLFILSCQCVHTQTLIEQEYRVENEEFVPVTSVLSHDNESIILTIRHGGFNGVEGTYSYYERPFLLKFNAETLDFEEKINLDYEDIDSLRTFDSYFNIVKMDDGYLLSQRYYGEPNPAKKYVLLKLNESFEVIKDTIVGFENFLGGETEGAISARQIVKTNNRYFLFGQRSEYDTLEQHYPYIWMHEVDEDLNIVHRNDTLLLGAGLSTTTIFQDSIFILTFGISPVNFLVGINDEGFYYLGAYEGDYWGDRRQNFVLSDSLVMNASLWIEPVQNPPLISYGGLYLGLWNYYTGDTSDVSYTYFRNAEGEVVYPESSLGLAKRYGISSFYKDKIYLAGSVRKNGSSTESPYGSYSPFISRGFYVCQVDSLANVQWFHPYGDSTGVTYNIRGVLATEDGGCIAYGTKNSLGTRIDEVLHIDSTASLILFKIDSTGIVTSTKEIQSEHLSSPLSIYPNPARNKIIISAGQSSSYQVKIVNISGQTYLETPIKTRDFEVNIANWATGVYYVSYWKEGRVFATGQFVKM